MGWLDNSTNNIILDAVLTDRGRQALAQPTGGFNITKFALGDDEINYGIITKYGRTIGREKIEKNTPVFEAFTNQNLALKNKLISIEVPLVYLPSLTLNGATEITNVQGANSNVTILEEQASGISNEALNSSVADGTFNIYYPSIFLQIDNASAGQVSLDTLRTAVLQKSPTSTTPTQRKLEFKITFKSLTSTQFQTYGRLVSSTYQIATTVKVVGVDSGLSVDIPVNIKQNA